MRRKSPLTSYSARLRSRSIRSGFGSLRLGPFVLRLEDFASSGVDGYLDYGALARHLDVKGVDQTAALGLELASDDLGRRVPDRLQRGRFGSRPGHFGERSKIGVGEALLRLDRTLQRL